MRTGFCALHARSVRGRLNSPEGRWCGSCKKILGSNIYAPVAIMCVPLCGVVVNVVSKLFALCAMLRNGGIGLGDFHTPMARACCEMVSMSCGANMSSDWSTRNGCADALHTSRALQRAPAVPGRVSSCIIKWTGARGYSRMMCSLICSWRYFTTTPIVSTVGGSVRST